MVINLNKKLVSEEELFRYIDHYDVYAKYIPTQEIIPGKNIYSPFRNESNPSFGFFMGENNVLCFHDFMLKLKGNSVKFVMYLFNLNYFEALSKIAIDFDMGNDFLVKNFTKSQYQETVNKSKEEMLQRSMYKQTITKKRRNWENYDLAYWRNFGISLDSLKKYRVEPVSHIFIGDKIITADKYCYCFLEFKDLKETYKFYQPFNKDYKWINTHNDSVWQGWDQLPLTGDNLIITKSLKDVMSINEVLGYHAVALQSENVSPKQNVMLELKKRFNHVFLFYDNDYDKEINWGQTFAKELCDKFMIINLFIDDSYKAKDFSDLVSAYGIKESKKIFEEKIFDVPF